MKAQSRRREVVSFVQGQNCLPEGMQPLSCAMPGEEHLAHRFSLPFAVTFYSDILDKQLFETTSNFFQIFFIN